MGEQVKYWRQQLLFTCSSNCQTVIDIQCALMTEKHLGLPNNPWNTAWFERGIKADHAADEDVRHSAIILP